MSFLRRASRMISLTSSALPCCRAVISMTSSPNSSSPYFFSYSVSVMPEPLNASPDCPCWNFCFCLYHLPLVSSTRQVALGFVLPLIPDFTLGTFWRSEKSMPPTTSPASILAWYSATSAAVRGGASSSTTTCPCSFSLSMCTPASSSNRPTYGTSMFVLM